MAEKKDHERITRDMTLNVTQSAPPAGTTLLTVMDNRESLRHNLSELEPNVPGKIDVDYHVRPVLAIRMRTVRTYSKVIYPNEMGAFTPRARTESWTTHKEYMDNHWSVLFGNNESILISFLVPSIMYVDEPYSWSELTEEIPNYCENEDAPDYMSFSTNVMLSSPDTCIVKAQLKKIMKQIRPEGYAGDIWFIDKETGEETRFMPDPKTVQKQPESTP